jgi:hypothetical protein
MSSYEVEHLRRLFDEFSCYDDRLDFRGFLRILARLHPRTINMKNFCSTAIYYFQIADTNDDDLVNFEEFLLTYVEFKSSLNSIRSDLMRSKMNSDFKMGRSMSNLGGGPKYMQYLDKKAVPIERLANKINRSIY